jgi:putative peptidoglycan lipid II flippase
VSKNLASIGAVSGATILSRILGLARDMLTAAAFGASALNSAYVTAFMLPNLFRRLLGEGALTAAMMPTLNEELEEGGRPAAFTLLNKIASWLLVVTSGLVLLGIAGMGAVFLFGRLDEQWRLGAHLGQILFPYMIVICLAAAFSAALNLLERFFVPAVAPVALNLAIIGALGGGGYLLAETPLGRMYWLCGGTLVGGLLQFLLPAAAMWREGWRPRFDFAITPRLRELVGLMGPGLFGAAIFQINILTTRGLAFGHNESAATLLYLANRVMEVPLGVFTLAVSTVTFPLISRLAVRGDHAGMAGAYHRAMLLTMHIAVPAALGLFLLAEPITRLLFQRGEFGAADTVAMIPVMAIFCLGLPFYAYSTLVTRAFQSLKDTVTPVRVGVGAFVLNVILSVGLMLWLGTNGLALASNLAIAMQTIVLQWLLGRRVPSLAIHRQLRGLGGIAGAALAMGVVVGGGWWGMRALTLSPTWEAALALAALIPLGAAAYFVIALTMRVDGLEEVRALVRRLRERFVGSMPVEGE